MINLLLGLLALNSLRAAEPPPALILGDIFGRNMTERTITLIDWDGYIANPAILLGVSGPNSMSVYPITVELHVDSSQVYFDEPSMTDESGSTKTVVITERKTSAPFRLSVWPDRNSDDEDYTLTLTATIGTTQVRQTVPIHVRDEDVRNPILRPLGVTLDTQYDKSKAFSDEGEAMAAARLAVDDWAYFMRGADFDQVRSGSEKTVIKDFIGNLGDWKKETKAVGTAVNKSPFDGHLLYLTGTEIAASRCAMTAVADASFQRRGNRVYPFPRSSQILLSFAPPGWLTDISDTDWWQAQYKKKEKKDLYSVVLHEAGHALGGITGHNEEVADWVAKKQVDSVDVGFYMGYQPGMNDEFHLTKGVPKQNRKENENDEAAIDPVSQMPAFGGTSGVMLHRRWLITKLDLLLLRSLGYPLASDTSALRELEIDTKELPNGTADKPYRADLVATGGVAIYNWKIRMGELPSGIDLDPFTGHLEGTPKKKGIYQFVAQVEDYSPGRTGEEAKAFQVIVK